MYKVPVPNLGSCQETGQWSKPEQITECKSCISNSTSEYPLFYCDGQCRGKYDLNGMCELGGLVAKTQDQCYKPCKQVAPPSVKPHECEDNFDCPQGKVCTKGLCVENTSMRYKATNKPKKYKNDTFYSVMIILVLIGIIITTTMLFK